MLERVTVDLGTPRLGWRGMVVFGCVGGKISEFLLAGGLWRSPIKLLLTMHSAISRRVSKMESERTKYVEIGTILWGGPCFLTGFLPSHTFIWDILLQSI